MIKISKWWLLFWMCFPPVAGIWVLFKEEEI